MPEVKKVGATSAEPTDTTTGTRSETTTDTGLDALSKSIAALPPDRKAFKVQLLGDDGKPVQGQTLNVNGQARGQPVILRGVGAESLSGGGGKGPNGVPPGLPKGFSGRVDVFLPGDAQTPLTSLMIENYGIVGRERIRKNVHAESTATSSADYIKQFNSHNPADFQTREVERPDGFRIDLTPTGPATGTVTLSGGDSAKKPDPDSTRITVVLPYQAGDTGETHGYVTFTDPNGVKCAVIEGYRAGMRHGLPIGDPDRMTARQTQILKELAKQGVGHIYDDTNNEQGQVDITVRTGEKQTLEVGTMSKFRPTTYKFTLNGIGTKDDLTYDNRNSIKLEPDGSTTWTSMHGWAKTELNADNETYRHIIRPAEKGYDEVSAALDRLLDAAAAAIADFEAEVKLMSSDGESTLKAGVAASGGKIDGALQKMQAIFDKLFEITEYFSAHRDALPDQVPNGRQTNTKQDYIKRITNLFDPNSDIGKQLLGAYQSALDKILVSVQKSNAADLKDQAQAARDKMSKIIGLANAVAGLAFFALGFANGVYAYLPAVYAQASGVSKLGKLLATTAVWSGLAGGAGQIVGLADSQKNYRVFLEDLKGKDPKAYQALFELAERDGSPSDKSLVEFLKLFDAIPKEVEQKTNKLNIEKVASTQLRNEPEFVQIIGRSKLPDNENLIGRQNYEEQPASPGVELFSGYETSSELGNKLTRMINFGEIPSQFLSDGASVQGDGAKVPGQMAEGQDYVVLKPSALGFRDDHFTGIVAYKEDGYLYIKGIKNWRPTEGTYDKNNEPKVDLSAHNMKDRKRATTAWLNFLKRSDSPYSAGINQTNAAFALSSLGMASPEAKRFGNYLVALFGENGKLGEYGFQRAAQVGFLTTAGDKVTVHPEKAPAHDVERALLATVGSNGGDTAFWARLFDKIGVAGDVAGGIPANAAVLVYGRSRKMSASEFVTLLKDGVVTGLDEKGRIKFDFVKAQVIRLAKGIVNSVPNDDQAKGIGPLLNREELAKAIGQFQGPGYETGEIEAFIAKFQSAPSVVDTDDVVAGIKALTGPRIRIGASGIVELVLS